MKQYTKLTSVVLSAAIAASSFGSIAVCGESGETKTSVTITFDISEGGITVDEGILPDSITVNLNGTEYIPDAALLKEGYAFSGWTEDGVRGYAMGEVINVGTEDITLRPVWVDDDASVTYTASYAAEPAVLDGVPVDEKNLPKERKYREGQFVEVQEPCLAWSEGSQTGWLYNGEKFRYQQHIIMPAHDIVLTPAWAMRRKVTYLAGDYDDIVGAKSQTFEFQAGSSQNTAARDRFSRKGYNLTGWLNSYDGETYGFNKKFVMPDEDITMTAIWKAKTYNIVFSYGEGTDSYFTISGETDSTITIPECPGTKDGYTFAGWICSTNDQLYQPGDSYVVEGQISGLGISFDASWTEGGSSTTTTTVTTTTTTTTSETTSTTTSTSETTSTETTTSTSETTSTETTTSTSETTSTTTSTSETTSTETTTSTSETTSTETTTSTSETTSTETTTSTSETTSTETTTSTSETTSTETTTSTSETTSTETTTSTSETTTTTTEFVLPEPTIYGDSNNDGEVNLSDAILIMQYVANPDVYGYGKRLGITAQGLANADVYGNDGVTNRDALAIQKYKLSIISKLPEE